MATVNLGSIKFNWRGAYNNSTAYVVDDVISSAGASYICILASTGNTAPNATYWELMSVAGADGTDLGATITTQGDIAYRDGSGLQRLAAGTSGQVLKTQGAGANVVWGEGGGGLASVQVFEADATWTKPAGIKSVRVQMVGSGAHGDNSGWGGGAGGYCEKFIDVYGISSVSVTVGNPPGSGAGNTSSFGSHCSATGGAKHAGAHGGYGGDGTGGDINIRGGGGDYHDTGASGAGGSSYFGGSSPGSSNTTDATSRAAIPHGAGGMGVYNGYTQGDQNSVPGIVIVWEYK